MKLRKVKGHATDEMVDEGKVEGHEQLGNDKADVNADKGAYEEDKRPNDLVDLYSHMQTVCANLMTRIKKFIIGKRKAEKEEREKLKASGNPFNDPKAKQIQIPKGLEYAKEGEVSIATRISQLV